MSVIAVFPMKTGDSMFVGFDSQNTSYSFQHYPNWSWGGVEDFCDWVQRVVIYLAVDLSAISVFYHPDHDARGGLPNGRADPLTTSSGSI